MSICVSFSFSLCLPYSLHLALSNSSLLSFFNYYVSYLLSLSLSPLLYFPLNISFFTFHFTFLLFPSFSVPPSFLCIFTPPLTFSLLYSLSLPPPSMPAISSFIFWLNTLLFACLFLVSIFLSPCQHHLPLVLIICLSLLLSPASVSAKIPSIPEPVPPTCACVHTCARTDINLLMHTQMHCLKGTASEQSFCSVFSFYFWEHEKHAKTTC